MQLTSYKKKLFILASICFAALQIKANGIKYPAFTIADTLTHNARSVVRDYETTHSIESLTRTKTTEHIVITVLNEKGKKHAWQSFGYDNNSKITRAEYYIYNSLGKLIDKVNKKGLQDISYDPYGTTYSDTRLLIAQPISTKYPYTVEYYVEYTNEETYSTPNWFPFQRYYQSIENSSYHLNVASGINVNINEQNLEAFNVKTEHDNNMYSWSLSNFHALKSEPFSPFYEQLHPFVEIVTNSFIYEKHAGSYNSWEEIGSFYHTLYSELAWLPDDRIQEVLALTSNMESDYDKVMALYKYMQSHTRYISIQVGIGGIQPIAANIVSETGYGDCKALSNYMLALLKAVNINSHIAIVEAGKYEYYFNPEFVKHHGNHAILCVPLENDTVWLECTSQTMPFNYLGDFTDNRDVLLITDKGGKLAKTPVSDMHKNKISRKGVVYLSADGHCTTELKSVYTGLEYDEMHAIAVDDFEEQKKALYENYDFNNAKIDSFSLEIIEQPHIRLNERLHLKVENFASKSNSRLFLPLNYADPFTYVPREISNRKWDIHKKYSASYSDTIQYILPDEYTIEVLPEDKKIESKYGNYTLEITYDENTLFYIRNFSHNAGVYPAHEYESFIEFYKQIKKNEQLMAVLKLK